jgi:hypothetical protein
VLASSLLESLLNSKTRQSRQFIPLKSWALVSNLRTVLFC